MSQEHYSKVWEAEVNDLKAALAEKEREIKKLKGCDIRLGDDYGDDPVELALVLKKELAELREKVRRWAVASEKLKTMVQNDYYVDDHTAAKHNMKEAEAVLRAAVEKKK